jgi:hypothetical protein
MIDRKSLLSEAHDARRRRSRAWRTGRLGARDWSSRPGTIVATDGDAVPNFDRPIAIPNFTFTGLGARSAQCVLAPDGNDVLMGRLRRQRRGARTDLEQQGLFHGSSRSSSR